MKWEKQERILLVDADSKIPNLALMKLKAYYQQADIVKCGLRYSPHSTRCEHVDATGYDKVFVSAIFFNTPKKLTVTGCSDIEYGGTAYSLTKTLPPEIASLKSDYSIYSESDTSYGFLTRGCFRNCSFCVVRKKEGTIHLDESLDYIQQHDKVKFLDNNILCHPRSEQILQMLIDRKVRCQFNQGLDIRILTDEKSKLLSKLSYLGEYIFAFDGIADKPIIVKKLAMLKKYIPGDWRVKFFIYCHPNMDIQSDVLHRVRWCQENYVLPYLMRDELCWDSPDHEFYADLFSWCNWPAYCKKMTFQKFLTGYKYHGRLDTIRTRRSIATYEHGHQDPAVWQAKKNMQTAILVEKAESLASSDFEDLLI